MTRSEKITIGAVAGGLAAGLAARRARRQRRALDFRGKVVVITGGSRGLGLVLARHFTREGASVALLARDSEELRRAAAELTVSGADAAAFQCDVADKADVERAFDRILQRFGTIDVVVNNAGVIQVGPLAHMTYEDFQQAMAVHFWGPLHTTLAALPHLRGRGGRIVNISSIGGKVAVPHLTPYTASKFALVGLSEGPRTELAREGIRVTTVCPGLMRTGSSYNAWFKGNHRQEFTWFHVAASAPILAIDATRAARQVINACRRGDAELIITPQARFAVVMNALCPGTTAAAMSIANRLLPSPV